MVDIYLDNSERQMSSRTALQEISPNKAANRKSYTGIKLTGNSISSKISKYPSGSGSPFSISAYQNGKTQSRASLPWSRRSTSIGNSFTVFPETGTAKLDTTPRLSSSKYENAVNALRALSSLTSTDEDKSDSEDDTEQSYSIACRDHAGKLRNRLRLAYYKVLTNQTALSINQITLPDEKNDSSFTPMKKSYKNNTTNSTPGSMGAAKSLLSLGTF